ncbi:MAG: uroporphyrinogen decarboxylase family protein [Blautia massiliensis (ex Durand et al. 2017)]
MSFGLTFVLNTPYQTKYPMMPEGPGAPTVKCGWGYYNSWPAGTPGAFPLHDPEHLVCPDVAEWKKYVKAPDIKTGIITMVTAMVAPGVFEMCHYLCEIQNTMINFYEEPEAMHELIEYITEWELKWAEQVCTYMKPDVVFHHDDWGTQKSTFISVDMFREFFMDSYKRIYGYYHDHGVELIIHHNDSYSATLVPTMIEMGIDVWQGCMSVNDLPKLIKEYGKDITFMGGIDNGKVDRFDWNQEMIEESTDQLCRDCGKLYFIPCTTHGLNFSCIPGVYEAVDKEIDKMTKEMF